MPRLVVLAALVSSLVGCAHAPTSAPAQPDPVSLASPDSGSAPTAEPDPAEPEIDGPLEVPPNATVLVMEAEDLGGGPHAVVAAPKRPELGSMMSGIGMAPSH